MSKIDVAYIVSHGFASRMVTQTNLLGLLKERGMKVALIVTSADDSLRQYCLDQEVEYYHYDSQLSLNKRYALKRRYYTGDVSTNAALKDKHIHDTRFSKSRNPLKRILPYYYRFADLLDPITGVKKRFLRREKSILISDDARSFLESLDAKWLVSTYPVDFVEGELLANANLFDKYRTIIHLLSWDNITCKGYFPALADLYIAWGPIMRDELIETYQVKLEEIVECGVPHFDLHALSRQNGHFKEHVAELGLDPDRPYILFAMSSPYFAPGEIEIVQSLSEDCENREDYQLVIRPHPQNVTGYMADLSWIEILEGLHEKKNTAVDFPNINKGSDLQWSMKDNDMIRMSELLSGSAMVLNSGSTMSIDAMVHFKPVIITSYDGGLNLPYWKSSRRLIEFPHLKKLLNYEGIAVVKSRDQLLAQVNSYLDNPKLDEINRQKALESELSEFNGNSTRLVCDALEKWVKA